MNADTEKTNIDPDLVSGFGNEWRQFDQTSLDDAERERIFGEYFRIFPWEKLSSYAVGADIGCGSGRWASLVAPRVRILHCVDPSEQALAVARGHLASQRNVSFHGVGVHALPFERGSLDFAYSLGVLHHVPDTALALRNIAEKLRPGAIFLVYLYYAFDNRPFWYRWLWRATNWLRMTVARWPFPLRYAFSQVIATCIYLPIARTAAFLERIESLPPNWPLAYYRNKSFYVMRTDALDRFGTRLEHRFTKSQIQTMLESAGFADVQFSNAPPYWCAVAVRR